MTEKKTYVPGRIYYIRNLLIKFTQCVYRKEQEVKAAKLREEKAALALLKLQQQQQQLHMQQEERDEAERKRKRAAADLNAGAAAAATAMPKPVKYCTVARKKTNFHFFMQQQQQQDQRQNDENKCPAATGDQKPPAPDSDHISSCSTRLTARKSTGGMARKRTGPFFQAPVADAKRKAAETTMTAGDEACDALHDKGQEEDCSRIKYSDEESDCEQQPDAKKLKKTNPNRINL